MSGVEMLGLVASVSQLTAFGLKISTSIFDIYRKLQDAPREIRRQTEQVGQLIEIASCIERSDLVHTVGIGSRVTVQANSTLSQAKALSAVLDELKSEFSQSPARRFWKTIKGSKEKEILAHFRSLEKEKSALQLCIALCQTELLGNIQGSLNELYQKSTAVMGDIRMKSAKKLPPGALEPYDVGHQRSAKSSTVVSSKFQPEASQDQSDFRREQHVEQQYYKCENMSQEYHHHFTNNEGGEGGDGIQVMGNIGNAQAPHRHGNYYNGNKGGLNGGLQFLGDISDDDAAGCLRALRPNIV
ncbi:hypothetical protein ACLMJK_002982 [Lecanora helva]